MIDQKTALSNWNEAGQLFDAIKTPDTPDHYEATMLKIGELIAPLTVPMAKPFKARVAFYCATGHILAHIVELGLLLRGLGKIGHPIEPYIVTGSPCTPEFLMAFQGHRIITPPANLDPIMKWVWIQDKCRQIHMDAFVHVSVGKEIHFAAGIRMARKHVWWSMKWGAEVYGIDAYFRTAGPNHRGLENLRGVDWRMLYAALPEFHRPELAELAAKTRATIAYKTVYGTCARNEKFSAEFIERVKLILERDTNAFYLYGARKPIPEIDALPRTQFIDWPTPALFVQTVDVFLDTHPFPGGHVVWEAIAAKTPVVLSTEISNEQPFPFFMFGGSPCLAAANRSGYIEIAEMFARHEELRTEWTERYRKFYETEMCDEEKMAREFLAALDAVI